MSNILAKEKSKKTQNLGSFIMFPVLFLLNEIMKCNCRSSHLYANENNLKFKVDGQQLCEKRLFQIQKQSKQTQQVLSSIYENAQTYLPIRIDKIHMDEIYTNPLWFYKNYISSNKPCIIEGAMQEQIVEKWRNPKQFLEITQKIDEVSVALTPDGFADSIKNKYFVEPLEQKMKIKDLIDWKQAQKQNNKILPEQIPYIQHQNSNLTEQMSHLIENVDQQAKDFISHTFFQGKQPDASNFWMGFQNSVSSLHKDPYQNFYTTLVGEKHFTLLPPISFAFLQEDTYSNARWKINQKNNQFYAQTQNSSQYSTTNWISCNPDLQSDYKIFQNLSQISSHHVILEAGQTLYLPSLWYHQVAQMNGQDQYTVAVNYWFDMDFGNNYAMFQTVKGIKKMGNNNLNLVSK